VTLHVASATVEAGSRISADGQGYAGATQIPGQGLGPGGGTGSTWAGGGSYGGVGGSNAGATYGSPTQPADLGSGGGTWDGGDVGGAGGGAIRLIADGTITVDGTISANGGAGRDDAGGGGSGGSIWLTARSIYGSGSVTAGGGSGGNMSYGGGGGGGRIALEYADALGLAAASVTAPGGPGRNYGAAGSVTFRDLTPSGPRITAVSPAGPVGGNVSAIHLTLSKPVAPAGALDSATYSLLSLGPDGLAGTEDDMTFPLTPSYVEGSTQIDLAVASRTYVDLSHWSARDYSGTSGADWQVKDAGTSAWQFAHAGASMFLSDYDLINGTFTARMKVDTYDDNDQMGLVFGYHQTAAGIPDSYYVLTWKQAGEGSWEEGFKLLKVTGTAGLTGSTVSGMLGDGENGPYVQVLAAQNAGGAGWADYAEY
jgi:hypothetical protein